MEKNPGLVLCAHLRDFCPAIGGIKTRFPGVIEKNFYFHREFLPDPARV
jgi:hypothetical protein